MTAPVITPAIGSAIVNTLVGNVTQPRLDLATIKHQFDIIDSEFEELRAGINELDLHELRDGLMDVRFTVDGMAHRLGFDVQLDYDALHASQMSKFDVTPADAERTRQKYEAEGLVTRIHKENLDGVLYYVTLVDGEGQLYRNRPVRDGKFMKSWHFKEPVYAPRWLSTQVRCFANESVGNFFAPAKAAPCIDLNSVSLSNPAYIYDGDKNKHPFAKVSIQYRVTDDDVSMILNDTDEDGEDVLAATVTVTALGEYAIRTIRPMELVLLYNTL